MKLSEFVQYDLSGERSNFKRMDVRFSVFTNNQVLYLNEPAYANSIKLYYANSNFEKVESPSLVRGTHYTWEGTYEKNCRDYNAESHARVLYTCWPYRLKMRQLKMERVITCLMNTTKPITRIQISI